MHIVQLYAVPQHFKQKIQPKQIDWILILVVPPGLEPGTPDYESESISFQFFMPLCYCLSTGGQPQKGISRNLNSLQNAPFVKSLLCGGIFSIFLKSSNKG